MNEDIEPPDSRIRVYVSANGGGCALINGEVLKPGELFSKIIEYENEFCPKGFLKIFFNEGCSTNEYYSYCCALDMIEKERRKMAKELLGIN